MKHLRLFETESGYTTEMNNLEFPCVSYVKESKEIICESYLYYIDATYRTPADAISTLDIGSEYNIILGIENYGSVVSCDTITPIRKILCNGQVLPKESYESIVKHIDIETNECLSKEYSYSYNFSDEPTTFRIYFNEGFHPNVLNILAGNNSLIAVDLSGCPSSSVHNYGEGFRECWNLEEVNFGKLDLSTIDLSNFFGNSLFTRTNVTKITMLGNPFKEQDLSALSDLPENGTFYYGKDYDYSRIIEALPTSWIATQI